MATIPKPRSARPDNLPVPAPPTPMRAMVELEPERGYLSREMAELAVVPKLTGEEDTLVYDNGRAYRSPLRYILSLARQENAPTAPGRVGGGGGRHTYERSVSRAPLASPDDADAILAVRDGQAIRLNIGDILNTVTASEILTLLKTVDGAGSALDADLLDGQSSAYYTDIVARLGFTPLDAASYTAADVLSKIKTVDGAGSGLDADLLDGQSSAYFLDRTNHTGTQLAATISDFSEAVDDRAAALIQNGTGITWVYNDAAGALTPTISLSTFSTSNLSEGSNLYYTDERVDDRVAVLIQNGTGITWSYNDASGTLTPTIAGLTTSQFAANVVDTDVTLAANSNTRLASQAAVKAYADALIAANDAMVFKGVIDCSSNPNYPAADRGHVYKVSVAGKIGGASGPNVEAGDQLLCITDGTAAGNHATVGANWNIIQVNLDGAVIGPASVTDSNFAQFDGTTGKLIKGGKAAPSGTVVGTTDTQALSNKDMSSGTNTWPTFNQNTTGSAAKLTTARNIDGQAFDGTANITVIAPGTHAATSKTTPVDADEIPLVDSAASNVLKRLTWANLKATLNAVYDWATVAHAATGKATPVDADELSIVDSAASNVIKKLTWANLKATIKTYLDTLYAPIAMTQHQQTFTASGTFTTPAETVSTTLFKFIITGGGGGGGSATGIPAASGGGAAGGTCIIFVSGLAASTGHTITVGAAGTAGSAGGTGGAGGASSLVVGATTYTGSGGGAGGGTTTNNDATPGGTGATATNGTINVTGGDGGGGLYNTAQTSGKGGDGGASFWGGGGKGAYGGGIPGADGKAYGSGGGGSCIHTTGGAGKAGIVTVEWTL